MSERPVALPPVGGWPCSKSSPKKLRSVIGTRGSAAKAPNGFLTRQLRTTFSTRNAAGCLWPTAMNLQSGYRLSREKLDAATKWPPKCETFQEAEASVNYSLA